MNEDVVPDKERVICPYVDVELAEMLSRAYGRNYVEARKIARETTFEKFSDNLYRLETIVGFELAEHIVKEGKFAHYLGNRLEHYLALARQAVGKLNANPQAFYDVESLENALFSKEEPADVSRVKKYKIFQGDNAVSCRYLDSLVAEGEIAVDSDERWNVERDKGPRGNDILKIIRFQLTRALNDLGLEAPECEINFGQRTLNISPETQRILKEIRDRLYQSMY